MAIPKEMEKQYFTYAEYKHWPDDERWEIIDGEAYDMSVDAWPSSKRSARPGPAPGMTHQRYSVEIFRQIANYLEDKPCQVFSAPFDVFLPEPNETEDKTSTIVQPDISIICDKSKLSEKGCTGCPDVVIEIISSTGASRDQIKKRHLYEKKGVKEYWIVHPVDKILWKYILVDKQYGKPQIFDYKGTPSFEILPDFKLDLLKVFGPDEQAGMHARAGTESRPG